MKKYTICGLSLILVFLISCTRSAVDKNGANVVIKIPSSHELQAKTQNFSSNNYVNKLIQKNALQTMSSDPAPTGFDGTRPLNCFAVMVSVPVSTEDKHKYHCSKNASSQGAAVSFGADVLSAVVSSGGAIEMTLDSGPDRVFRLIGLHSKNGACPGIEESGGVYGNGYLVGEESNVDLIPSKDTEIRMKMSYDSDKYVDQCDGVNFREDSSGGGDNSANRLAVKKDYFPVNQIVESTCQSVDVVGQNNSSNFASVKSTVTFKLLGNGAAMNIYSSYEGCSTNSAVSDVTITAGQDRSQIWFVGPSKNTSPNLDISISFASNPDGLLEVPLTGIQVRSSNDKSFEIYAPNRILAGSCYQFNLDAKYMSNSNYSSHFSATTIAVDNGAAYSDSSCTTSATSVSFTSGKSSSPIYVKTSGLFDSKVKITASYSGFVDGEKIIEVGTGSSVLANVEVRHNNQTMVGDCVKTTVTFLNENYTAINLPAALTLNMSGSGSVASYYNDQWCMAPNGGVSAVAVAAGASSAEFYFSPLIYGTQIVQLTTAEIPAYGMQYFANYQYKISATPSSYTVAPGECVPVAIYTQYQNSSAAYFGTPTTVNVTSPFAMFSDSVCKNNIGNSATIQGGSNYAGVFFLIDNATLGEVNLNLIFQAAGLSPSSFSLTVSQRPAFSSSWGLSAHKVPHNYPLDMKLFWVPFTGIGPYTYSKTAGTGSLAGDIYSPVAAENAAFAVSDSQGATFNITAQTVQNVFTNNFVAGQLPSGYSFSRGSVGKYYDSSGTLVDATAGTPRFDRDSDPATGHAAVGLLIEPASTNHVVYSSYLSASSWNKSYTNVVASTSVLDPTGNSYSDVLEWNNPTFTNMAYASSQAIAPSGGITYSGSVFVKQDTARFVGMKIHEYGSSYGYSGVVIDLATAAVVGMNDPWSGDYSANFGVQKLKNGWFRIWTNYVAKGGSGIQLYLYPAYHGGTTLTPVRDNTATGRTYFWGAQLEVGESVTSYIPTSAVAASRNADAFSVAISTGAPTYASATESTIRFEYSRPEGSRPTTGALFAVCGTNCSMERINANVYFGDSVGFEALALSGGDYRLQTSSNYAANKGVNKLAVSISNDAMYGFNWALNTSSGTSATAYGSYHPNFSNGQIYLGSDGNSLNQTTIHLRSYELWADKISGPGLKTMTNP
ncbi:MAG: hypothetical protein B7Y39_02320 [Bdellovibrio sp. 28-41-41]|nr:MAG: hypothetical protein B7Y39_02320 [Bdellovibrio sp. 28-41-41]